MCREWESNPGVLPLHHHDNPAGNRAISEVISEAISEDIKWLKKRYPNFG